MHCLIGIRIFGLSKPVYVTRQSSPCPALPFPTIHASPAIRSSSILVPIHRRRIISVHAQYTLFIQSWPPARITSPPPPPAALTTLDAIAFEISRFGRSNSWVLDQMRGCRRDFAARLSSNLPPAHIRLIGPKLSGDITKSRKLAQVHGFRMHLSNEHETSTGMVNYRMDCPLWKQ